MELSSQEYTHHRRTNKAPVHPTCPMFEIPELLSMVMDKLNLHDMKELALANHRTHQLVIPYLYYDILVEDCAQPGGPVNFEACGHHVRHLTITNCRHTYIIWALPFLRFLSRLFINRSPLTSENLQDLIPALPASLHELALESPANRNQSGLNPPVPASVFLGVAHLTQLRVLVWSCRWTSIEAQDLLQLLVACPQLRCLKVWHVRWFENRAPPSNILSGRRLQILDLKETPTTDDMLMAFLGIRGDQETSQPVPLLEELSVQQHQYHHSTQGMLSHVSLTQVLECCPHLKVLSIRGTILNTTQLFTPQSTPWLSSESLQSLTIRVAGATLPPPANIFNPAPPPFLSAADQSNICLQLQNLVNIRTIHIRANIHVHNLPNPIFGPQLEWAAIVTPVPVDLLAPDSWAMAAGAAQNWVNHHGGWRFEINHTGPYARYFFLFGQGVTAATVHEM